MTNRSKSEKRMRRIAAILARQQLDKHLHARQSDWLPAVVRLAVARADGFAPVGGFDLELVEEGGLFGGAAFDELAVIAADGGDFLFPEGTDVENERRLRGVLEVHAIV